MDDVVFVSGVGRAALCVTSSEGKAGFTELDAAHAGKPDAATALSSSVSGEYIPFAGNLPRIMGRQKGFYATA